MWKLLELPALLVDFDAFLHTAQADRREVLAIVISTSNALSTISVLQKANHRDCSCLIEAVPRDPFHRHLIVHDSAIVILLDCSWLREIDMVAYLPQSQDLLQDIGVVLAQFVVRLQLADAFLDGHSSIIVRLTLVLSKIEPELHFLARRKIEDAPPIFCRRVLRPTKGAAAHDKLKASHTNLFAEFARVGDVLGEALLIVDRTDAKKLE